MLELYSLLILMFLGATSLLTLPFVLNNKSLFSRNYFLLILFMCSFSFLLYKFSAHNAELKMWLTQGREHYLLQEKFDQLGGVEGVIVRIKAKLAEHPEDVQGWIILAKLYHAKHDEAHAKAAITKVQQLEPQNPEMILK